MELCRKCVCVRKGYKYIPDTTTSLLSALHAVVSIHQNGKKLQVPYVGAIYNKTTF